ncbi:MAG: leucine-rich repeat-containing protein kinase family protein [Gallionella sp.]
MHTLSALRAGNLAGIKRLDLSCGLTEFPNEIFALADTLEILNLSGNALSRLPDDLHRLHKLRVIFCSDNLFAELPAVLGRCTQLEMIGFKANKIRHVSAAALPPKLRWLILTDNQIVELPDELGSCTHLQKLMLSSNQLQTLPNMSACVRLELLRIAANRFADFPDWIFSLPRLAWLACAGNPCSDACEVSAMGKHPIKEIDWNELDLQQPLGEGASGVIYRANQKLANGFLPVAVKVFKGAVTSDGLPRCEKSAAIAAGVHPVLIPVIGKIIDHPEDKSGLVMSLVASSFINLAAPPSLESCTRDIYAADIKFTLANVLNMALSIADVAAHLHAQGLMHGDLYAHNILWNGESECLLGDFGGACFVPQHEATLAMKMQRLEVRAFACLLEELLDRCDSPSDRPHIIVGLRDLQHRCNQSAVNARPLFSEIHSSLKALKKAMAVVKSAPLF